MVAQDHNVLLIEHDSMYILLMLERIVLKEEVECQKREKEYDRQGKTGVVQANVGQKVTFLTSLTSS